MLTHNKNLLMAAVGMALLAPSSQALAETAEVKWKTVVDNGYKPPGATVEQFFSYNQPSVNEQALVVFRARAKKPTGGGGNGGGKPIRGVFVRNMASGAAIRTIASNKPPNDVVPAPNNTAATFNEFPSFPRIDKDQNVVAFRAQSTPSWKDPVSGDTVGGTSGVYANPGRALQTGVRNLETAAGFTQYLVPSVALSSGAPLTKFDQFPGAPGISEGNRVTFKGNYTDGGLGKTGIFFRSNIALASNLVKPVAWTDLAMPDKKGTPTAKLFGSTAPPSTANREVVFAGFDNEEKPTAGGIFHARLADTTALKALVSIGDVVPGVAGAAFTRFGEALSFDGRYVTFWGAWGTQEPPTSTGGGTGWRAVTLNCPTDGNQEVIQACIDQDDSGDLRDGEYTLYEPVNQGMFRFDKKTGALAMVAKTGDANGFETFLFWSFTGAPPGAGGGDEDSDEDTPTEDREPPRWRNSAFAAVSGVNVAFKAKKSEVINGIYLQEGGGAIQTVLDTTMTGDVLDNKTITVKVDGGATTIPVPLSDLTITTLGLERDAFRKKRLAISASMANDVASWAGIYLGKVDH